MSADKYPCIFSPQMAAMVYIFPSFQNRLEESHIKVNVRMAERFAFLTKEEINLLVDKAIPEKTKKSTSYAVNVFDGKVSCLYAMFIFITSSLRDFRLLSAKFHSVQQSLNLRYDRKTHAKRRKTASQSYARVFIISFSLAKGEGHQQVIKRVYKRRARKCFA